MLVAVRIYNDTPIVKPLVSLVPMPVLRSQGKVFTTMPRPKENVAFIGYFIVL